MGPLPLSNPRFLSALGVGPESPESWFLRVETRRVKLLLLFSLLLSLLVPRKLRSKGVAAPGTCRALLFGRQLGVLGPTNVTG